MGAIKKGLTNVVKWAKRHKVLTVLIAVALVVVIVISSSALLRGRKKDGSYNFIRTVTLSKGALEETVEATGTVESANTSTVSYSASGMSSIPKVKVLNVAVGDSVSEGDVLVVLDAEDIEKAIDEEKEAIEDREEQYKEAYEKAEESLADAKEDLKEAQEKYDEAKPDYEVAEKKMDEAEASIQFFLDEYDLTFEDQVTKGLEYNTALQTYNELVTESDNLSEDMDKAYDGWMDAIEELAKATTDAQKAAAEKQIEAKKSVYMTTLSDYHDVLADITEVAKDMKELQADYEKAVAETQTALAALNAAKAMCNYDGYKQQHSMSESTYKAAEAALDQAEARLDAAEDSFELAKENYENVHDSDLLEDLYEKLDACNLKAETSGKVTALNVRVGDTPSGVIATVQDTESLKIAITVQEADIHKIALGMPCRISSDGTENDIEGTLTQLDPVAGPGGTFGAEVTVKGTGSGLLIGMNANVEIVVSSTEDCFRVPMDAVGNDDDGQGDYVYRRTGGSGVDMTFEKVYVVTGDDNDYYVEVSSDDLSEGDVIRATADLSVGIESSKTHTAEDAFEDAFGTNMGGGMQGGMQNGMRG